MFVLRKTLASGIACLIGLQPALADTVPFFRHKYNPLEQPQGLPDISQNNVVPGTGSLRVNGPILVRARLGVPFVLPFAASNADGDVSWASVGRNLPQGLTLSPDGVLSGTPSDATTAFGILVRGTDASGKVGTTQPFTIDARAVPSVAMTPSTSVKTGQPVSIVPTVQGLYGSKGWTVAEGSLPVGLSLDPATGVVSGTALQGGSFPGTVIQVTDSDGAIGRSNRFALTVSSPLSINGIEAAYRARSGRPMPSIRPYATGATGNLLWSLATGSPAVPPGIDLDGYSGALTGTPSTPGETVGLSLLATDATTQDLTASRPFSMKVAGAPALEMLAAYEGRTGRSLTITPKATGLLGGGRWFVDGALPDGATIDTGTGVISGVARGGAEGLRLRVVDLFDGAQATGGTFAIRSWPALTVTAPGIPGATAGKTLSMDPPTVLGLRGAGLFSLSGTLPKGVVFDPTTGKVSGKPEAKGVFAGLTYGIEDAADKATASSEPFDISVAGPADVLPFSVTGVAPSYTVEVGKPFVLTPSATGSSGNVSWTFGGTVPAWLATDAATGRLSGTPTQAETSGPLTVLASDATGATGSSKPFTVTSVPPEGPGLTMSSFSAVLGRDSTGPSPAYSGLRAPLSYALVSGLLPSGLTLAPSTGLVSGAPGVIGDFEGISLKATDANGATAVSAPFTVSVLSQQDAPAAGTNNGTGSGSTGTGSTGGGTGTGGTGGGSAGGSTGGTGSGGGTGTGQGGTGSSGGTTGGSATSSTGTGSQPPESVAQRSVYAYMGPGLYGATGQGFIASPAWSGLTAPLTWALATGTLPPWAGLNPETGAIGGNPTGGGAYEGLSLFVRDATGLVARTNGFFISVSERPSPRASMPASSRGWIGLPFSAKPSTSGTTGGLTWRLASGQIPAGLSLDPISGLIGGTPSSVADATGLSLSLTDASGAGTTTNAFGIKVTAGPTASVANGSTRVGAAFALTPSVADAYGSQAWTLASGTLPAGLSLNGSTGAITGRPTATGTQGGLTLRVSDASGLSGTSNAFSVTVGAGPSINGLAASYGGRIKAPVQTPILSLANALGTVTWSATGLPSGLSLVGSGLSGTTDAPGSYPVTVTATDGYDGAGATAQTTLAIAPALAVLASPADVAVHSGQPYATLAPTFEGRRGNSLQWTLDSGTLPQGASLDGATGVISSPSAPTGGNSSGIRLSARDPVDNATARTQPFSVSVVGPAGIVEDVTSYTARLGSPLATSPPRMVNAIGAVTWSWGTGVPPAWARVDAGSGSILGTPNALATTAGLSLIARDASGATASTVPFSLKVYSSPTVSLSPATTSYALRVGDSVSITPQADGVAGTVAWSLETSGTMPTGLTQDPVTGRLYGTLTGVGNATLTLVSTDSTDGIKGRSAQVRLSVLPTLTVSGLASGYATRVNTFVATAQPQVTGGQGALSYAFSPSVPAGMSFGSSTPGVLSGIPTAARTKAVHTVTVTDATDGKTASAPFDFAIYSALALSDPGTVTGVANGSIGRLLSTPIGVSGTATYGLKVNGTSNDTALAACGMTFDTTSGMVGSASLKGCSLTGVQVTVRDDNATYPSLSVSATSPSFSVNVAAAPFYVDVSMTTMNVSAGTTGQIFTTVNKTAGTGTIKGTVTWTIVGDDGGTTNAPPWSSYASCSNDANSGGCLVKFNPPASTPAGTWPQGGGSYRIRVVDTTGFAAYSVPFTVNVVDKVNAASVRPVSAVYGGGLALPKQRCTGCSPTSIDTLWKGTAAVRLDVDSSGRSLNVIEYDYGQFVYTSAYWMVSTAQNNTDFYTIEYWDGGSWVSVISTRGNYNDAAGFSPVTSRYFRIKQTLFISSPVTSNVAKFKFGDNMGNFPP